MPGTIEDATLAVSGRLPEIGRGCSRVVFLKDNVVYKVEHHDDDINNNANEDEYFNFTYLRDITLPPNVGIPDTSLFWVGNVPVIAMDFIPGHPIAECYCYIGREACNEFCMPDDVRMMLMPFINDTAGFNVIEYNGLYWIIDMEQ